MFENIIQEVSALAGFAMFITFIVNLLKIPGWVKDGTADKWVAGFNLAGVIALFVVRLFIPDWNAAPIDTILGQVAIIGGYILEYVLMLFGSKFAYAQVKGLPGIGKSYSV